MKLLRLYTAIALLRGAGIVAGVIVSPDLSTGPKPTCQQRLGEKPGAHPAERTLLASLAGLAICFLWIWINRRAWE
jgi:hypothetical protein